MRARRTLLAFLSTFAFAAVAAPPAMAFDDADLDGVADWVDNCPTVANGMQLDADGDGKGNICDETPYESVDGRVSGGGDLYHLFHEEGVLFSMALRRDNGKVGGTGRFHDTKTGETVRITDVDSLWIGPDSIGRTVAVATGTALVNGTSERFFFETIEGEWGVTGGHGGDYTEIRTPSYTFGGHVRRGNLDAR